MAVRSPNLKLFLLLVVFPATAGKYVRVAEGRTWFDAQQYCKTSYTDLAPVSNEHDLGLLSKMTSGYTWIGLMRNRTDRDKWQWSGGAQVSKFFWNPNEPNGKMIGEDAGFMLGDLWYDLKPSYPLPFICYKVHAVREMMTWYEALQYCRKNHQDLASVASETEMMLIETELRKELSTFNVWIGLQFMNENWQWMDRQPFSFESWGPDPKSMCPDINDACGAIRVRGQSQQVGEKTMTMVDRVLGWNALDCNKRIHFLCY